MRTPLSFDKDTAILLASCCELTYEQYKQNGIFEIPDGFQYVQGFSRKNHSNDRMVWIHIRI